MNFLLLSHAHIYHSGLIPKEGFAGTIFCTSATKDLAAIPLEDSTVIQRDDTKFINRKRLLKGRSLFEPLYTIANVKVAMELFNAIDYDRWVPVTDH